MNAYLSGSFGFASVYVAIGLGVALADALRAIRLNESRFRATIQLRELLRELRSIDQLIADAQDVTLFTRHSELKFELDYYLLQSGGQDPLAESQAEQE